MNMVNLFCSREGHHLLIQLETNIYMPLKLLQAIGSPDLKIEKNL